MDSRSCIVYCKQSIRSYYLESDLWKSIAYLTKTINDMPTPIDRAMQSRNLFLGFAGLVAAASIWNMFGGDMFPAEKDPTGDPETWTDHELRRWLKNVRMEIRCLGVFRLMVI